MSNLLIFSAKLYDTSFGNAKGGRTNDGGPVWAKVAKHRIRARVSTGQAQCQVTKCHCNQKSHLGHVIHVLWAILAI